MLQNKPRIESRTNVMLRARLRDTGPVRDACIVNLSSRGLSASADNPPRRGDYVELVVGDIVLVGQVKWTSMRRFGMTFRERINVAGLLAGDGDVRLGQKRAARKQRDRKRAEFDGAGLLKKFELVTLAAAGAGALFVVADFAGKALHSLDDAKVAMAGKKAG